MLGLRFLFVSLLVLSVFFLADCLFHCFDVLGLLRWRSCCFVRTVCLLSFVVEVCLAFGICTAALTLVYSIIVLLSVFCYVFVFVFRVLCFALSFCFF